MLHGSQQRNDASNLETIASICGLLLKEKGFDDLNIHLKFAQMSHV